MFTNEGRINYQEIVGFKAEKTAKGSYRIYVTVINEQGNLSVHEVCETTAESFLMTWKGVRSLATILTDDEYLVTI